MSSYTEPVLMVFMYAAIHLLRRCARVAFVLLAMAASASAATLTWNGLGGDDNIGTAANWSPVQAPVTGDTLVFAGTNRLTPQEAASFTAGSITFNSTAGAFTLGGLGTYTINSSGVTNNSANLETIN